MSPHFPHILCSSERHLKKFELYEINVNGYGLGTAHCRKVVKRCSVCIFVPENLRYTNIDLGKYCKDQDKEVCVLKLNQPFSMFV